MKKSSAKTVKLSSILEDPIKNGYSPVCIDQPTSKKILGLGALTGSGLNLNEYKWVPNDNRQVDKFILKEGDFLISRSNTPDKVGRAALYRGGLDSCSYPDLMMKFRIDQSKINPDFLEIFLQSEQARKYFKRNASGTSESMVKLTKTVVEKLSIPLFTMKEQIEIVQIMNAWASVIEKTESLIAAKEKQFEWLKYQLFKDVEFHSDSMIVSLKNILTETIKLHEENEGIVASVGKKGIRDRSEVYSKELSKNNSKNKLVQKNEIAFGLANDAIVYGVNFTEGIYSVSPAYKVFRISDCNSAFFQYLLDNNNRRLSLKYLITSARQGKSVDFKGFLNENFFIPSLERQNYIIEILSTAKKEIELLKALIKQYRAQKLSLMHKLLSGEWRLKNICSVIPAQAGIQEKT